MRPVRLLIAVLVLAAAGSAQALGSAPAPAKQNCKIDVSALKKARLGGRAAVRVQTKATCATKQLRTLDIKLVFEYASGAKVAQAYSLSGGRMTVYRFDGRSVCPAALPVDGAGNKPVRWWVRTRLAKGMKRPYPQSGGPLIATKDGPRKTIASICPSSLKA